MATKQDFRLMANICKRYESIAKIYGITIQPHMDRMMDLEAAHDDIPLRLAELLAADQFNFVHDVAGIHQHMDRTTRKLGDCFVPRYAKS